MHGRRGDWFKCSGDAEVEDLRLPVVGHEDVGWFQIPVQHAAAVRVIDPIANLREEFDAVIERKRTGIGPRCDPRTTG
ncbi:MAG: hypothetical protein SGJ09_13185 [Phycisphaerae bacterium]|nr:hypothetical protein [Phycisphaerae bacterium]